MYHTNNSESKVGIVLLISDKVDIVKFVLWFSKSFAIWAENFNTLKFLEICFMIQYMFNICMTMFDNLAQFFFFTEKSVKISSYNYGSSISHFGSIIFCFMYFKAIFLIAYQFKDITFFSWIDHCAVIKYFSLFPVNIHAFHRKKLQIFTGRYKKLN